MMIRMIFILLIFLFSIVSAGAQIETAVSDNIPWSGWWWPETSGGLATGKGYHDHPAPLEKYDLLTSKIQQGPASNFYLLHNYDPSGPSWFGLCDAWAAAAILEPIDFTVSSVDNLFFHIGDKKGLLTYAHQMDYNTGESQTMDSPLVLHNWLQKYIRDQGKAFYADLDPGPQSWNYPIYKYSMNISDFGDEEYVVCTIFYADNLVDPDYSGTKERMKTYYYTLFKDGKGYSGGEWGMQSSYDHPQILISPGKQVAKNPYLDYKTIKMIAESKDDTLESDLPVSLNPGMYNQVLMNQDHYILNADPSDIAYLVLERLDETDEFIKVLIKDSKDDIIYSGSLSGKNKIPLDDGQGPYELILSKDGYDNPGLYKLEYDIKKQFEYVRPKVQKGFGWGGYAILNTSGSQIQDTTITGYTKQGMPLDSFLGPFFLASGEKKVILSSDFPFRNQFEKQDFYGIKIHSSGNFKIVNLSGLDGSNMAFFPEHKMNKKLIIPENPNYNDYSLKKTWGIYNPSARTATLSMTLFSKNGILEERIEQNFNPKEMLHFNQQSSPFEAHTDNGWVSIESDTEFSGYEEWLSNRNDANEILPALIPGKVFYVPHLSMTGGWNTKVTIINLAETSVEIPIKLLNTVSQDIQSLLSLSAYEKVEIDLKSLFLSVSANIISSSIVKIESENEIAGYYTYTTSNEKDFISLPFTDTSDMKMKQTIPHVASSNIWWTGISLCNTGEQTSIIKCMPYDSEGKLLEENIVTLRLEKNGKYTGLVSGIFGRDIVLSYFVISVEQGSPVFGTYGYGISDMKMLAGSKLN